MVLVVLLFEELLHVLMCQMRENSIHSVPSTYNYNEFEVYTRFVITTCGFSPSTTRQLSGTSWVSCNSAKLQPHLFGETLGPTGEGLLPRLAKLRRSGEPLLGFH